MHLGDVLELLIGVWGVVWRRVGLSGNESEGMEHRKNPLFLMIFTLRVSLKSSSKTKEAVKRRSGNRTCIHERFEVIFSMLRGGLKASRKRRGGLLRRLGGVTKKQKDVRRCEYDAG